MDCFGRTLRTAATGFLLSLLACSAAPLAARAQAISQFTDGTLSSTNGTPPIDQFPWSITINCPDAGNSSNAHLGTTASATLTMHTVLETTSGTVIGSVDTSLGTVWSDTNQDVIELGGHPPRFISQYAPTITNSTTQSISDPVTLAKHAVDQSSLTAGLTCGALYTFVVSYQLTINVSGPVNAFSTVEAVPGSRVFTAPFICSGGF